MPGLGELFGDAKEGLGAASLVKGLGVANPYLLAASALVPFLLRSFGSNAESDTNELRGLTQAQAATQTQLQRNLQSQLRGEETPATRAIMNRLQQTQRGQRQALAASQQQAGVSGTSTGRGQFNRQNEQFNQILVNLLGQLQLDTQRIAAGQAGITQAGQATLAQTEQQQLAAFNQGIGNILNSLDPQDNEFRQAMMDFFRQITNNNQQSTSTTVTGLPPSHRSGLSYDAGNAAGRFNRVTSTPQPAFDEVGRQRNHPLFGTPVQ